MRTLSSQSEASANTLLKLADRIEREGPSRKLDHAIADSDETIFGPLLNYTTSIDDALTLVPEGRSWEVRRSGFGDPAQACIWNPRKSPGGRNDIRATLNNGHAAAALCVACLRARAAMVEGET